MVLARVYSSAVSGVRSVSIEVEVTVAEAQREKFTVIGLVDSAVKESRDRVLSAICASGYRVPNLILANLAPAELRKEGSSFDLPIALATLVAAKQIDSTAADIVFVGELALDGRVRPVKGVIAHTVGAVDRGFSTIVVPVENYQEAKLITGVSIVPVSSLMDVIRFCQTGEVPALVYEQTPEPLVSKGKTLSDVYGQESAKRALLIAAAGGHNLLMIGPPGCGKSMLAERLSSLLPPLREEELREVVGIHSIAGLDIKPLLAGERPFRAPHHVISDAGLIGGGTIPRPGEISLCHRGVLFLDEFPEFSRNALEAMRNPLESGRVLISRARGNFEFPARFSLIAAMNPCPCGRLGVAGAKCLCSKVAVTNYLRRLSQPILDRIDLHVELGPVPLGKIHESDTTANILYDSWPRLVQEVRNLQFQRFSTLNSQVESSKLFAKQKLSRESMQLARNITNQLGLSARGYVRLLRVARTIADLEGSASIEPVHLAEASSFRSLDSLNKFLEGGNNNLGNAVR